MMVRSELVIKAKVSMKFFFEVMKLKCDFVVFQEEAGEEGKERKTFWQRLVGRRRQ